MGNRIQPPRQKPVIPIFTACDGPQINAHHITMRKHWCHGWSPSSRFPIAGGDALYVRKAVWKDMGHG